MDHKFLLPEVGTTTVSVSNWAPTSCIGMCWSFHLQRRLGSSRCTIIDLINAWGPNELCQGEWRNEHYSEYSTSRLIYHWIYISNYISIIFFHLDLAKFLPSTVKGEWKLCHRWMKQSGKNWSILTIRILEYPGIFSWDKLGSQPGRNHHGSVWVIMGRSRMILPPS